MPVLPVGKGQTEVIELVIASWRALNGPDRDVIFGKSIGPAGWDFRIHRDGRSRHQHRRVPLGSGLCPRAGPCPSLEARTPGHQARHDVVNVREEPGPGKPLTWICNGESRMAELVDH